MLDPQPILLDLAIFDHETRALFRPAQRPGAPLNDDGVGRLARRGRVRVAPGKTLGLGGVESPAEPAFFSWKTRENKGKPWEIHAKHRFLEGKPWKTMESHHFLHGKPYR